MTGLTKTQRELLELLVESPRGYVTKTAEGSADMKALAMRGFVVDVYEMASGGFHGSITISGKAALAEARNPELYRPNLKQDLVQDAVDVYTTWNASVALHGGNVHLLMQRIYERWEPELCVRPTSTERDVVMPVALSVRERAIEECARVADDRAKYHAVGMGAEAARIIAKEIRALSQSPPPRMVGDTEMRAQLTELLKIDPEKLFGPWAYHRVLAFGRALQERMK